MALALKKVYEAFTWLHDFNDPRSDDMFYLKSFWAPFLIIGFYLCFVSKLGPTLMKNRKPYNVKIFMTVYNILQVVLNAYCSFLALKLVLGINWRCAEVDFSDTPHGREQLKIGKIYYFLKIMDLIDTVFIVLKKNFRQASFLHSYHHSGMILAGFVGFRFVPGGQGLWVALVNSFVHMVMYSYYLLTVLDEKWKKNVMKKFLTQLQLIQFCAMIVIFGSSLCTPNCTYSKFVSYMMLIQNVFMVRLFLDFYLKAYHKTR